MIFENRLIKFFFFILVLPSVGCIFNGNTIQVNEKKAAVVNLFNVKVSNIQVLNHQIVITGTNLSSVKKFKIQEGATTTNLSIESQSSTSIVANVVNNVTFAAGRVFSFILSDANAAATFTVNFSLCDSNLNGKSFNCTITPNDKEVLSYDATTGKWLPRAVNGLSYQGAWDATTSLPSTTTPGDYFIVSVAHGSYLVGDWIVFNGTVFDQIHNSTVITNVFGRTGAIAATKGDYSLTKMSDVDLVTTAPVTGNVLKYDGTNWVPGTVSAGSGGTVTGVSGTAPISVATGTSTPVVSIAQATNSASGYLSSTDWTNFNNKQASITAGTTAQYYRGDKTFVTLDTSVVPENTNLYFTNARALGVPLTGFSATNSAIVATDTILQAMGKAQGQIDSLSSGGSNYLVKNGTDSVTGQVTINATTGSLKIPATPSGADLTDAVNVQYVNNYADNKVAKSGDTMTGDLQLNAKIKLKDSSSNTVSIKAPATVTSSYVLTLPSAVGSNNQVLTTDNTGALSWTTPSTTAAPTGSAGGDLTGSYPNPSLKTALITDSHIATTLSESKITNLVSDLAGKMGTTLTSGNIFVGNGSNVATGVAMSGDAALSNAGVLTLATSGATAGTYTSVTVDAKGRVTGGTNPTVITSVSVTAPVTNSGSASAPNITIPAATTSVDGYLKATDWTIFNNKQSTIDKTTTQPVSKLRVYGANATNYVEISAATLTANRSLIFPDSNGSSGNVLSTDGAGNLSWIAIPSAPVSSVNGNTGAVVLNSDSISEGSTNLYYTNARGIASTITAPTLTNSAIATNDTIQTAMGKLQAQLNNKDGLVTAGTTSQYYRGDKTFVTLDTSVVPENTNLYFTSARALAVPLTGFSSTNSAIVATDTILQAMNKAQGQIDNKVSTSSFVDWSTSGVQTIDPSRLTLGAGNASKAVVTNASGIITAGGATSTEVGYLSGVTSNIQTQINAISSPWTVSGSNVYRSSGSVGIGTTGPDAPLTVLATASGTLQTPPSGTVVHVSGADANNARFVVDAFGTGSQALFTARGARGTASGPSALQNGDIFGGMNARGYGASAYSSTVAGIYFTATEGWSNSANGTGVAFYTVANGSTSLGERMRLDNNGRLGIATTSPAEQLDVVGNIKTSGCLYYASSSLGTCASDKRIKKNVHAFDLGLDVLLGINPVQFQYNGLAGFRDDGKEQLGVIAQDLEKVAPTLVKRQMVQLHPDDTDKTEIKVVDYGAFTYVIINSIKKFYQKWFDDSSSLHREIASVKSENEKLKQENLEIKTRLLNLEKEIHSTKK